MTERNEMPPDPVSPIREAATEWHQEMLELMEAGFTRKEAFRLMKTRFDLMLLDIHHQRHRDDHRDD